MNNINLNKIERFLFSLLIILIPLNHIPTRFSVPIIGQNAPIYPFLLLMILSLTLHKKNRFTGSVKLLNYFFSSVIIGIAALCHGIFIYSHYDLFEVSNKLSIVISFFNGKVDVLVAKQIWFLLRMTAIVLKENILFVGIPFLMITIYGDDWKKAFRDVRRAVIVLVCIFGVYSIPEMIWLKMGSEPAAKVLRLINPYLYDVGSSHGWWPPLEWWGQLRSICPEPSFFGIIGSFAIPFLWSELQESKSIWFAFFYCYYMLMLFLTKARTGLGLFIGEFALYSTYIIFFKRKWIKTLAVVILTTIVAFNINLLDWKAIYNQNENAEVAVVQNGAVEQYINNNVVSVASSNARSNSARRINVLTMLKVGMQYPVLGVGKGLMTTYITENLPAEASEVYEVRNWARYSRIEGVLKSGYPTLNQYVGIFAEEGIVGLIVFLVPIIYILKKMTHKKAILNDFDVVCVLIALIGQLVAMLSNVYMLTYPITLGLMYCIVESGEND